MGIKSSRGTTGSIHSSTQHFEEKQQFFLFFFSKQKATVRGGSSNCWFSNEAKGINDLCCVILFRLAPLSQQLCNHNTAAFVPDKLGASRAVRRSSLPICRHMAQVCWPTTVWAAPSQAAIQPQQAFSEKTHALSTHKCSQIALSDWIKAILITMHPS